MLVAIRQGRSTLVSFFTHKTFEGTRIIKIGGIFYKVLSRNQREYRCGITKTILQVSLYK